MGSNLFMASIQQMLMMPRPYHYCAIDNALLAAGEYGSSCHSWHVGWAQGKAWSPQESLSLITSAVHGHNKPQDHNSYEAAYTGNTQNQ